MKALFLFLSLSLALTLPGHAWDPKVDQASADHSVAVSSPSQDQPTTQETLEQQELPPATSVVSGADDSELTIAISDKLSYTIENTPNLENMRKALGLVIPDNVKEKILQQGGVLPPVVNPLEGYESLSPESKVKFQKIRQVFLQNVARALNSTKFAFGVGSIVGDSFRFVKKSVVKMVKRNKNDDAAEATVQEKLSFSERSQKAVQSTLQALDYKLWNQAPLLLESNEFGVSGSLGIMIENGVFYKGIGGSEELGLAFAYNKTSKAFVMEIYHNSENFAFTPWAVTAAGVLVKAGPQFGSRNLEKPMQVIEGKSFYPPAMPGYSTQTPNYFSAGFSTSFGFPPNPIVDMLTYTHKMTRNTLIRLTVSPVTTGFARLYIGNFYGAAKLVVYRFVGVYQWISDKVKTMMPAGLCRNIYL